MAVRDDVAAGRLTRCREVVTSLATHHRLPPENLVSPDAIRRLAWTPPSEITPVTVDAALTATGVRAWQRNLLVAPLAVALVEPPPPATTDSP
jgi:ribonuclease D